MTIEEYLFLMARARVQKITRQACAELNGPLRTGTKTTGTRGEELLTVCDDGMEIYKSWDAQGHAHYRTRYPGEE